MSMTIPAGFDTEAVQVRTAVVVGVDDEGLVEAKLAPYEVEAELADGVWEVFTRGAFAGATDNPSRCKVSDQGHQRQVVIGHAAELRSLQDGMYGKLKIADTVNGRDVLTLMRSGSLTDLSVEFRPQKKHMRISQRAGGGVLIRHDKATLVGVSPVGEGAYGEDARVLMVREASQRRAREEAIARLSLLTAGPKRG
jgi:HK97 family phage prohead protease